MPPLTELLPYLIGVLSLLLLGTIVAVWAAHSRLNDTRDNLDGLQGHFNDYKRENTERKSDQDSHFSRRLGKNEQRLKDHERKLEQCKERIGEMRDYLKGPAQQQHGQATSKGQAASGPAQSGSTFQQATGRSVQEHKKRIQDENSPTGKRKPAPDNRRPSEESHSDLIERYNHALGDDAARREFESTYHPARVGVVNSEDRVKNADAPPVFGEGSSGDYWVVQHEGAHLAAPRLGLVLQNAHRSTGAMDQVFQCGDRERGPSYEVACLEMPARLAKTHDGNWKLEREGKIELRRYD